MKIWWTIPNYLECLFNYNQLTFSNNLDNFLKCGLGFVMFGISASLCVMALALSFGLYFGRSTYSFWIFDCNNICEMEPGRATGQSAPFANSFPYRPGEE